MQQVTKESSQVLTAYMHNLFAPHPAPADTVRLFSYESLLHRVRSVVTATRENTSSMANDVLNGRMTEIDYINGHIATLGHRLGVPTPVNRMLVQMVKFKAEVGGLGGTVAPRTVQYIRAAEEQALEVRRLSLEERKVLLQERAMVLKEERTAEAKRDKRELKRTVRRNAAIARNLRAAEVEAAIRAGADPKEVLRASEASSSGTGSDSEWSTASSGEDGEGTTPKSP
jgi:2-dehydropantoate 2-reductase